jgi:predicted enzyme related to lactoylglutathione lyase
MTIRLHAVTLDCADAAELGRFWARALDRELDPGANSDFASIGLHEAAHGESRWAFAKVPEPKTAKNRMHPDLMTEDLETEVKRLTGLGAIWKADVDFGTVRWSTLADPEGNEFDVIAQPA